MKLNESKIEKINETIKDKTTLNIGNSIKGTTIYDMNWEICTLDNLKDLIDELAILKAIIEEETGIEL